MKKGSVGLPKVFRIALIYKTASLFSVKFYFERIIIYHYDSHYDTALSGHE